MNFFKKKIFLLLGLIPLHLFGTKAAKPPLPAQFIPWELKLIPDNVPPELKAEIFNKVIDSVQTLPELKKLFNALDLIRKDLRHIKKDNHKAQPFRSMLFKKIESKECMILHNIIRELGIFGYDIVNKGINGPPKMPDPSNQDRVIRHAMPPLVAAAYAGKLNAAKLLIENGADINIQDKEKWTALNYVAAFGREKLVDLFIQHKASMNIPNDQGNTPLHTAIIRRYIGIATLLVDKGADTTIANLEHKTALDLATSCNLQELAALIKRKQSYCSIS